MRLRIEVEKDTARPLLDRIEHAVADRAKTDQAAAAGMLPPVQSHLRKMAASNHNPFGVRSSFWNLQLSATRADADGQGPFVAMPRPVALRALGGTVSPVQSKYLAIPARSEAYNKSPKDFNDLHFVMLPNGRFGARGALVQNDLPTGQKTRGKRKVDAQGRKSIAAKEAGGMVFFWLVPQATIAPNHDVLPTEQELEAGAARGIKAYIDAAAKGGA